MVDVSVVTARLALAVCELVVVLVVDVEVSIRGDALHVGHHAPLVRLAGACLYRRDHLLNAERV